MKTQEFRDLILHVWDTLLQPGCNLIFRSSGGTHLSMS
jgi:hypothetical protein